MMIQQQENINRWSSNWDRYEDKLFEQALVFFPENTPDRWNKIAERVPGKTPDDIRAHYESLVHDLLEIDSGRIQLPSYADDDDGDDYWGSELSARQISFGSNKTKHGGGGEVERKKGTPWTEDEHRLFLLGLEQYGKGDWRSISRNVVVTRTPTQVASHAQKYFLRQKSMNKERKRSSIHDITTTMSTITIPPSRNNSGEEGPTGHQKNYGFPM